MDNLQIVNTVIAALDQLTVQGARNMTIVIQCIQQLGKLRENLTEVKQDEQNKAE